MFLDLLGFFDLFLAFLSLALRCNRLGALSTAVIAALFCGFLIVFFEVDLGSAPVAIRRRSLAFGVAR